MKIRVTHEITDQQRLTLATATGERGLASRQMTEDWILAVVDVSTTKLDEAFSEAHDLIIKALRGE